MIVRMLRPLVVTSVVTLLGTADASAQQAADRWEKDIAAYEAADRIAAPPKGEIVFVGSSSILRWDTAASFPDLKIINRGFGDPSSPTPCDMRTASSFPISRDSSWCMRAITISVAAGYPSRWWSRPRGSSAESARSFPTPASCSSDSSPVSCGGRR